MEAAYTTQDQQIQAPLQKVRVLLAQAPIWQSARVEVAADHLDSIRCAGCGVSQLQAAC